MRGRARSRAAVVSSSQSWGCGQPEPQERQPDRAGGQRSLQEVRQFPPLPPQAARLTRGQQ